MKASLIFSILYKDSQNVCSFLSTVNSLQLDIPTGLLSALRANYLTPTDIL